MEIIKDFLSHTPVAYLQIVTAIIGTTQLYKYRGTILKYFVWAFWYFALMEFLSKYYGRYIGGGVNLLVYNVYYLINFLLLFAIFHTYIRNRKFKFLIKAFAIVYVLLVLIEVVILKTDFHSMSLVRPYIVAAICILICVLYYFVETLNSEQVIHIERRLVFWIAIGYFFYYLAILPLKIGQNLYARVEEYKYLLNLFEIMTVVLNVSLIIGFLWSHREQEN